MARVVGVLYVLALMLCLSPGAQAAAPTQPSVKDVALAFGEAIVHNDGGTAIALLSPDLRKRTVAAQLPAILAVQRPPTSVHVVRWAYDSGRGDATLSMRYPDRTVAEHLFFQLFKEGWRITAIVPEDALTLQRGAETTVAAFCDAAVRHDLAAMRAQVADRVSAKASDAQILALLGLPGPLISYSVVSYYGGAAGANVVVKLRTDTVTVQDLFTVINDRQGWRIVDIERMKPA